MKRNVFFIWCKNLIRRNGSWLPAVLVSLASMAVGASAVKAMSSNADSGSEVCISYADSDSHLSNSYDDAERKAEKVRRNAERIARKAQKEAERKALKARKDAEKKAREAERRATKARIEAERRADKARREAERRATKARIEAERNAERGWAGCGLRSVDDYRDNYGNKEEKNVRIGKFKGVNVSSAIEVVFTQGPFTGEAVVFGTPELMNALNLNTDGDVLTVSYAECNISSAGNLVVKISAPVLNSLYVSTAASFIVRGALKIKEPLNVTATSASSVNFGWVTGGELNIAASGAASVYALTLDLERVEVSATSASDVRLKGISAASVKASAKSASEVVLSGRCHHAEVKEGSEGSVKTRGLIIEDMPPRKAKEKEDEYMLRRP